MAKMIVKNPATGAVLKEIETTESSELPAIFERARAAQKVWGALSPKERATHLRQLRETVLNHVDDLAETISSENGKPRFEAMVNELFPSVELITYYARKG